MSYNFESDTYQAPIFRKVDELKEWNLILRHHKQRIREVRDKLEAVRYAKDVKRLIRGV